MKIASPDIQFELDDKPLTLRFSARALAALQDAWGLDNLDQVAAKLAEIEAGSLNVQDMAVMLWAGFRTHHSDITQEAAYEMLDSMGVANFEALISKAIAGASSGGGESAPANPPKGRVSPGQ